MHETFSPDSAPVTMDNPLHGRQSYTSAFKLFSPVQTLEYAKEFIDIFHLKTNAIVSNEHDDLIVFSISASEFIPLSFWYDAPPISRDRDRRHDLWLVY